MLYSECLTSESPSALTRSLIRASWESGSLRPSTRSPRSITQRGETQQTCVRSLMGFLCLKSACKCWDGFAKSTKASKQHFSIKRSLKKWRPGEFLKRISLFQTVQQRVLQALGAGRVQVRGVRHRPVLLQDKVWLGLGLAVILWCHREAKHPQETRRLGRWGHLPNSFSPHCHDLQQCTIKQRVEYFLIVHRKNVFSWR